MIRPPLPGLAHDELASWAEVSHYPLFRARQIGQWLYGRGEADPAKMANLPKDLRAKLAADFECAPTRLREAVPGGDGSEKLLLELADGECIEMVLIPSPDRMTFCLSTQVGCPVGCVFCASGAHGFTRNLSAGEILGEYLSGVAHNGGKKPDNIVFMGIGEGLLNFEALSTALDRLTGESYFGMSPRRIVVSTSGYVPGIERLAALNKPFTLAVSLHAADDALRRELVPNMPYTVAEILEAAGRYAESANRMVTLEYTMLSGVNDSEECARKLAQAARGIHAKVNLIPFNATGGCYRSSSERAIERFASVLECEHVTATIRRSRGAKGAAACGQLRARHISSPDAGCPSQLFR